MNDKVKLAYAIVQFLKRLKKKKENPITLSYKTTSYIAQSALQWYVTD